jgi:hypothetical protein
MMAGTNPPLLVGPWLTGEVRGLHAEIALARAKLSDATEEFVSDLWVRVDLVLKGFTRAFPPSQNRTALRFLGYPEHRGVICKNRDITCDATLLLAAAAVDHIPAIQLLESGRSVQQVLAAILLHDSGVGSREGVLSAASCIRQIDDMVIRPLAEKGARYLTRARRGGKKSSVTKRLAGIPNRQKIVATADRLRNGGKPQRSVASIVAQQLNMTPQWVRRVLSEADWYQGS